MPTPEYMEFWETWLTTLFLAYIVFWTMIEVSRMMRGK